MNKAVKLVHLHRKLNTGDVKHKATVVQFEKMFNDRKTPPTAMKRLNTIVGPQKKALGNWLGTIQAALSTANNVGIHQKKFLLQLLGGRTSHDESLEIHKLYD